MKEIYLGTEQDQTYIATYLKNIRSLDPIEIATLTKPMRLSDTLRMGQTVESELFLETVRRCIAACEEHYGIHITTVSPERYYTSPPPETDSVGGFHHPNSLGYQYWYHAAFVLTLNQAIVSRKVATLELVRSFLHDCFHHSTFRSFRRAVRLPAMSADAAKNRLPEIYREQYGINFRNKDGFS